ncbi:phytanoyl-CoA dioxygenase family protein [Novosphingobium sp.]|uniref:phytanoyl-CoA dioxygenase family protein n=1 Tax=Novosphingobium sp. TaxID=1874826 RepID=UPI003D135D29
MSVHSILPGVPIVESPLFDCIIAEGSIPADLVPVARALHERGFAVIDFPDNAIFNRIDRIKSNLTPRYPIDLDDPQAIKATGDSRIQDAWRFDEDVAAIASNAKILEMLTTLWGRRAFPFQTLNFPVGTQQAPHSDAVHFSSLPERFMCGVWIAFEDIGAQAGPLLYYPGSHRWPLLTNQLIGQVGEKQKALSAQAPFERAWKAMIEAQGIQSETFLARKGQALIWTANLLHGGSPQIDLRLTRWSQVTHYYFEDCIYYTPAFSDEPIGRLDLRTITNIADGTVEPNSYLGRKVGAQQSVPRDGLVKRLFGKRSQGTPARTQTDVLAPVGDEVSIEGKHGINASLPEDFDDKLYLALHLDVASTGMPARQHYEQFGRAEGRRYR